MVGFMLVQGIEQLHAFEKNKVGMRFQILMFNPGVEKLVRLLLLMEVYLPSSNNADYLYNLHY